THPYEKASFPVRLSWSKQKPSGSTFRFKRQAEGFCVERTVSCVVWLRVQAVRRASCSTRTIPLVWGICAVISLSLDVSPMPYRVFHCCSSQVRRQYSSSSYRRVRTSSRCLP